MKYRVSGRVRVPAGRWFYVLATHCQNLCRDIHTSWGWVSKILRFLKQLFDFYKYSRKLWNLSSATVVNGDSDSDRFITGVKTLWQIHPVSRSSSFNILRDTSSYLVFFIIFSQKVPFCWVALKECEECDCFENKRGGRGGAKMCRQILACLPERANWANSNSSSQLIQKCWDFSEQNVLHPKFLYFILTGVISGTRQK